MSQAYVLLGTENEYLLVLKLIDEKAVCKIIDELYNSRVPFIKELAAELEKSLHDDGSRRDPSKTGSKNKSKSPNGNNSGRRKTKDT